MSENAQTSPVFHENPKNQIAKEGQNVKFDCTVLGYPNFRSTWDKNGVVAIPSNKINIIERTNQASLEIKSVTREDAGIYRITVQNRMGRSEASAWLEIIDNLSNAKDSQTGINRQHLTVQRKFMGHKVRIGDKLLLCGQYRSQTIPAVCLYHNNSEIVNSDRVHIYKSKQCILVLLDTVALSDSGEYRCLINCDNDHVITLSTNVLVTSVAESCEEDVPRIVSPLGQNIKILEGCPIYLKIKIKCNAPYVYVWMLNEQILYDCDEYRYTDHGNGIISLLISDPFINDSGIYTCIVSSANGQCSSSCTVKVYEADPTTAWTIPEIIMNPRSVVTVDGSSVSLRALVKPANCPVQWFIQGERVDSNMDNYTVVKYSNGEQLLNIEKITSKLSGVVSCFAHLPDAPSITAYNSLLLNVIPSIEQALTYALPSVYPRFISYKTKHLALRGNDLTMEVFYEGYPEPHVSWMRAGRPLQDRNVTSTKKPGYSALHIKNICTNQGGKYSTAITNTFGSDIIATFVQVESLPEPLNSKPKVVVDSDCATITWNESLFDEDSADASYILEMQCDNHEWILAAIVHNALSYTIFNLETGKQYRFRVKTKTSQGCSEPSMPSDQVCCTLLQTSKTSNHKSDVHHGDDFKDRYEIQEELGRGRFGTVYRVVNKRTRDILAAKIIKCIKSTDKQKIRNEISIMNYLKHPKLLTLFESFESARELIMVTEFISGGELFERVVADDFTLTEKDCVIFLRQICEGVRYMHHSTVVHLDLKPENIMCYTRNSHQIKIIDFGLAQRLIRGTSVRVLLGTPEFVPPEIINYEPIGLQSDMWSVGVICYVLLSGLSPFMGETDVDTFTNITRAEYDFDDDAFDTVSEEAKDFIAGLLLYRKEDRLTAAQCLQTKWLALDSEILVKSKICTHKLKKFIIRRKWQKTGNAIRALGRMALLSASRRNSSISSNSKTK
ncbi:myosin light chain kinase, smooth muscle-like [Uranotaenia lowii]|uniref:myosin light chain kinase, smooth muscle-like n=1 Tax=Uranotaenia lowii TaxID=190385 RepID=UPI00247A076B|nr:myosin light chain kinase, smooth muscle-like [Uranotaenia lowii]